MPRIGNNWRPRVHTPGQSFVKGVMELVSLRLRGVYKPEGGNGYVRNSVRYLILR